MEEGKSMDEREQEHVDEGVEKRCDLDEEQEEHLYWMKRKEQ